MSGSDEAIVHDIGIVGAGIAGLHLGLFLLQRGIKPSLYTDRTPEEMARGRLPSTTVLYGTVRDQMRQLGVAHWDAPDTSTHRLAFGIEGAPGMAFEVPVRSPLLFIDMRLYLPKLLQDFAARGGRVITRGPLSPADLTSLGEAHDLVVVASGRGGLAEMFPRVPERSPFTEPQRRIMAGLFRGIRFPQPFQFAQQVVPGYGEVCELQILTHDGPVSGLLLLAVPGGGLDAITRMSYEADPAAFNRATLEILREHMPQVMARIEDPGSFGALGALDVLQGGVLPVVRRGFIELSPGRFALALGDTHVTVDPLIAQGSNAAAKGAWLLGGLLAARIQEGGAFDRGFCAGVEERLWEMLEPVSEWNSAALRPPAPHLFELIAAAAQNPAIAEEFVANFDDPRRQWEIMSTPEGTAAFIRR
jgi:hypothetical protein